MATWMLETLLKTGLVDSVACVGHAHSRDRLFCYHILEDIVKVREAAGSHYYPVDMADIIKVLQSSESSNKRYAVVGLPCRLKSLRLAMSHSPRLRQRLVFLVGLVCGHLPNLYYTEYLARLSGIAPGELATADYRLKQGIRAGNYYFQGRKHNGTLGRQVPFLGQVSKAWGEGYFQYNACNYCDDVFAEVADAVFMDAWLPEYESNPKGHSLVVVRHPELDELLRKGIEERTCHLESIPIDEVIASQKALVHRKKVQIGAHLHLARKRGEWVPNKRIQASRETYSKNVRTITAHYGVQRKSKELWPRLREKSLWRFHLHMLKEEYPLLVSFWWNRLCRVVARLWLALRPLTLFFRRRLAGGQRSRL
jgi:coenzyme F420-reducing hydrogenase beta subunit